LKIGVVRSICDISASQGAWIGFAQPLKLCQFGKFSLGYANMGKNSKINKFKVVFLNLIMQDN
jgi:hypothetical protein